MDKKSVVIFAVSFVLLLAWFPLVNTVYRSGEPQAPAAGDEAKAPQGETPEAPATVPGSSPGFVSEAPPTPAEPLPALPLSFVEEWAELESEEAKYRFSNIGGGIQAADLKHYPNETGCRPREAPGGEPDFSQLNPWASTPILGLRLEGMGRIQGYEMRRGADTLTMIRQLEDGLRVEKEFAFGGNYWLQAKTRIVNGSKEARRIPAQEWSAGTAAPMAPEDDGRLMGLLFFNGSKVKRVKKSWFANLTLGCIPPGRPRSEFRYAESPVYWAAVENQFFVTTLLPGEPAAGVSAIQTNLQLPRTEKSQFEVKQGFQTSLVFPEQTLPPGEKIEREFKIFMGPKKYGILDQLSAAGFDKEWKDGVMSFGGFFGIFAKALLLSMNWLHGLGLNYGLAIVAITFIIKLLFWPLTQASTRSMKRMAALQPQMKAIQEKYKDDRQKMNKKLMAFMRENRVSPLGGCLPILLQLPVFFGFYTMLQSAIELRGAGFLWTCDLSKPDTLFIIPGLGVPFNLWPILMGAAQLWQMSLTPPSPGMDPTQQKIMRYMPLMFVFILYNFSAGLALYWTVQNLLSIVQMKLTRNDPVTAAPKKPPAVAAKKKNRGKRKRPGL